MDISLTPELERFVNAKVKAGIYQSATEAINDGLQLLKQRDEQDERQLEELKKKLAVGIQQADRGETDPFDEKMLEDIRERGMKRLRAERKGGI